MGALTVLYRDGVFSFLDNIRHSVDDIVLNVMNTLPPHLPVRIYPARNLIWINTKQSNQSNHTGKSFYNYMKL